MSSPLDTFYDAAIQSYIAIIGREAAYKALTAEVFKCLEATQRQALSMDGAFANEAALIMREYPDWNYAFQPSGDGFKLSVISKGDEHTMPSLKSQASEIERRLAEAFERHNQVKLADVKLTSAINVREVSGEND